MLAEKCPDCGAFLPVRVAGEAIRPCELCGRDLPGDAPVVEVDRLTRVRPAVEPPRDDATSTWLPPPTPIRLAGADAGAGLRCGIPVVILTIFLAVGLLVAGIVYAIR